METIRPGAGETQSGILPQSSETPQSLTERAKEIDKAAAVAGEKLSSAAELLRQKAPREGRIATAATAVAELLGKTGSYLQEQGYSGSIEEVENLIRRCPVQALLLTLSVGYLLARSKGHKLRR
jgi:hypothetical protein